MNVKVTVDGKAYTGVDTIEVGGKTLAVESEVSAPSGIKNITANGTYDVRAFAEAIVNVAGQTNLPVHTGTFTTTKAAQATFTHGLGLSRYVFLWHFEDWEGALSGAESTLFMPMFGIVSYGFGSDMIPADLLANSGKTLVAGAYIPYKQNPAGWGQTTVPSQLWAMTNENTVCWGSGYGNFVGTYKYCIIDYSGQDGE